MIALWYHWYMRPLVDALITMEMIDKIGIFCPSMNTQYNPWPLGAVKKSLVWRYQWGDQKCHLRVRGVVFRRHEALDDVLRTSCQCHSSHTFGGLLFSEGPCLGIDKTMCYFYILRFPWLLSICFPGRMLNYTPTDVLRVVVEASNTILIRCTIWSTTLSVEEVTI